MRVSAEAVKRVVRGARRIGRYPFRSIDAPNGAARKSMAPCRLDCCRH